MAKHKILVVEDDPDISELLRFNLERQGYSVLVADDGLRGLQEVQRFQPDLVLLDVMLPGVDGLEVCRQLRGQRETSLMPVIMITARGEETDIVLGLELGADDYVTKPFSPREVVARVRARLRQTEPPPAANGHRQVEIAGLTLDVERYEARLEGSLLSLTRAEFRLLWGLCSRPGRVFTRDELVDKITAGESLIVDRNVDVHISAIRKKLGASSGLIATVRGVGYKCRD